MAAVTLPLEIPKPTWAELLGSNKWEGLLDPLNLSLRELILQCGDLCQASYDAFISDADSKYRGCSRYGMKSFFQKLFQPAFASNYKVIAFLYATPSSDCIINPDLTLSFKFPQTNWMGYIAVTTDEVSKANGRRDVYVVWRGTTLFHELGHAILTNLVSAATLLMGPQPTPLIGPQPTPFGWWGGGDNDDPKVMEGWLKIYTSSSNPHSPTGQDSARTLVLKTMKELMDEYKDENISVTFTGHSLGGVLAALSAFNVVATGVVPNHVQVAAFVFGSPMLGNKVFCDKLNALPNFRMLHVKNERDMIPNHPFKLPLGTYANAGIEFVIDTAKSPFLKPTWNPFDSNFHNLQVMLHVVAGWNGKEGEFELKVKRCLALVNKSSDFLNVKYHVLKSWWVEKNKGMVLDENGEWVEADPFQED